MFLILSMLSSSGQVAAKPAIASPLVTDYHFEHLEPRADGSIPNAGSWVWALKESMPLASLPATIRDVSGTGQAIVTVRADVSGAVTSCAARAPQEKTDVASALCGTIRQGRWPITFVAPGRPVGADWVVALEWETLRKEEKVARDANASRFPPPAPPAPPDTWPARYPPHALEIERMPDLAAFVPKQGSRRGRVGLMLRAVKDREVPDCDLRASSGDPRLDLAACAFAREVRLRYKQPCHDCYDRWVYPLIIEFDGGRSRVRLPLQALPPRSSYPRLNPMVVRKADVLALKITNPGVSRANLRVSVSAEGRLTGCEVPQHKGTPFADALCAFVSRQTFTPALDAFGDPIADKTFIPFDLSQL